MNDYRPTRTLYFTSNAKIYSSNLFIVFYIYGLYDVCHVRKRA